MKTLTSLFIFSLCSFYCIAQNLNGEVNNINSGYLVTVDRSDKTAIGSPYVNPEFVAAKVSVNEKIVVLFRYNAVHDEIEIKKDENQIFNLDKSIRDLTVTSVIEKKTYQSFDYLSNEGYELKGYFVHLGNASNTIKLLKKESIEFQNEKKATTSYEKTKPAQFKRKSDSFYIKIGDNMPVEFSSNKKDFAKIFDNNENAVLNYIKSEKIKLNKEDDLQKLSLFLNQLK